MGNRLTKVPPCDKEDPVPDFELTEIRNPNVNAGPDENNGLLDKTAANGQNGTNVNKDDVLEIVPSPPDGLRARWASLGSKHKILIGIAMGILLVLALIIGLSVGLHAHFSNKECPSIEISAGVVYYGQSYRCEAPHGEGALVGNGWKRQGNWVYGKQEGQGITTYYNASHGVVEEVGVWKNGKLTELKQWILAKGERVSGCRPPGLTMDGDCVIVYDSRANFDLYRGSLVNGTRQGNGTLKLKNGNSYTGGFDKKHFHGRGVIEFDNSDAHRRFVGTWQHGDLVEGAIDKNLNVTSDFCEAGANKAHDLCKFLATVKNNTELYI